MVAAITIMFSAIERLAHCTCDGKFNVIGFILMFLPGETYLALLFSPLYFNKAD